jgi:hypothetical protein
MATIKQFNNLAEEIEYGALANSCGFGQDGSKSSFRCIADEMIRLRKENEDLKSQRPKYTCPQDQHLVGDAAFDYYWTRDDADMTIWKVPRNLETSYHGAVEQAFYDEKFGGEYGKLEYLIVREMKEADLVKRKIQLKKEEEPEPICCVRCDEELDPAKKEVCPREWEGDSDAPMCADCWDLTEEEEDAEAEAEEEDDE